MANEFSKRSFLPALDLDDPSASVTVIRTRHKFSCTLYSVCCISKVHLYGTRQTYIDIMIAFPFPTVIVNRIMCSTLFNFTDLSPSKETLALESTTFLLGSARLSCRFARRNHHSGSSY